MQGIRIREVLLILVAFPFLNLGLKMLSIPSIGTIFSNIVDSSDRLPLFVAVSVAIVLTGLLIGKLVVWRIKQRPLYHALAIAIIACIYKAFRPDLTPISSGTQSVFLVLTFLSIMVGTYVASSRSA